MNPFQNILKISKILSHFPISSRPISAPIPGIRGTVFQKFPQISKKNALKMRYKNAEYAPLAKRQKNAEMR